MKRTISIICAFFALLSSATLVAMPESEFACKAQTVNVKLGVVLVQAHSRAAAAEIASRARAMTPDGKTAPVENVLECIRFPGENFQDREFNRFVNSLPL